MYHQLLKTIMDNFFSNRRVTILSIDGGGIRGLIPAKILQFLENELQDLENNNEENNKKVKLADYFDLIAGTSAGALITALLAAPNDDQGGSSPRSAEEIINLLHEKGPKIFSNPPKESDPTKDKSFAKKVLKIVDEKVFQPVYDGKHLELIVKEELGDETLLRKTSTNVLITTYDINKLHPIIFTTRMAKEQNSELKMKDIVVGSASAAYYFPPKSFEADGKKYKLVDGGIVANNPILLAIREATKLFGTPRNFNNYLILSLGTGKEKHYGGHSVTTGGFIDWFNNMTGTPPLLDVLFRASEDLADIMISFILGEHNTRHNYVRIQDYELKPEDGKLDDGSKNNLDKLNRIGDGLISKYVAIPNPETGLPNVISDEVAENMPQLPPQNQAELKRFAKILYDERRRRMRYKKYFGLFNQYFMVIMAFCFLVLVWFGSRHFGFI